jgi:hypothetical protein
MIVKIVVVQEVDILCIGVKVIPFLTVVAITLFTVVVTAVARVAVVRVAITLLTVVVTAVVRVAVVRVATLLSTVTSCCLSLSFTFAFSLAALFTTFLAAFLSSAFSFALSSCDVESHAIRERSTLRYLKTNS